MDIQAFGYYTTSRTLHNRLRDDFELPSLATLGRISSKVSKVNKKYFLLSIFNTLNIRKKKKLHKQEIIRTQEFCKQILTGLLVRKTRVFLVVETRPKRVRDRQKDLLHHFIWNIISCIRERERERERDLLHHFICNIISCIREREREREICCTVLYATL